MPNYDYACAACKRKFAVALTLAEHDRKKPKCPRCGSAKVVQQYGVFFAKTSRKS